MIPYSGARLRPVIVLKSHPKPLSIQANMRLIKSHHSVPPTLKIRPVWLEFEAIRISRMEKGKSNRNSANQFQPPAWVLAPVLSNPKPITMQRHRCKAGRTRTRYHRFLNRLT